MIAPQPVSQLVVLAHPDCNSFCASVARRWQERARRHHQNCDLRDLYADGFDPILKAAEQPGKTGFAPSADAVAERERLHKLDVLTLVYPVWFGTPPAMLKGYLERVVGNGISFAPGAEQAKPLNDVRLVQISTSASSRPWLSEKGIPGALHTIFDRYVAEVFGAKQAYHLYLDTITETMGERHAAFQFGKVDELADRVCADANADRWKHARA